MRLEIAEAAGEDVLLWLWELQLFDRNAVFPWKRISYCFKGSYISDGSLIFFFCLFILAHTKQFTAIRYDELELNKSYDNSQWKILLYKKIGFRYSKSEI